MDNELYHYGRKGMKWYQRIFSKDTSGSGGKKATKEEKAKADAKKKAVEARQKTLEAKKKAAEEKARYEAEKERAVKSGSAADVLKFKGDLTPAQMQAAKARLDWERSVSQIRDQEVAEGKSKADKFFDGMSKATDYAVTTSKAYNTVANIFNAFRSPDSELLPTIQTDNTKSNRAQRKAEAEKRAQAAKEQQSQKEAAKQAAKEAKQAAKEAKRAEKEAAREAKKSNEPDTGEIFGDGSSVKKSDTFGRRKAKEVVWEHVDDTSVSDIPPRYIEEGESRIAGYLPAPR